MLPIVGLLGVPLVAADQSKPPSRIERLETWLAAIEAHEPGVADEPVKSLLSWRSSDFWWLTIDLGTVLRLMNDPFKNSRPAGISRAEPLAS